MAGLEKNAQKLVEDISNKSRERDDLLIKIKEEQKYAKELDGLIDELTNRLVKINDTIKHPAYLAIQAVTNLQEDLIVLVVGYLNYYYCSLCGEIYHGAKCWKCRRGHEIYKTTGYVSCVSANGIEVMTSTCENDCEYFKYIERYGGRFFPSHGFDATIVYDQGAIVDSNAWTIDGKPLIERDDYLLPDEITPSKVNQMTIAQLFANKEDKKKRRRKWYDGFKLDIDIANNLRTWKRRPRIIGWGHNNANLIAQFLGNEKSFNITDFLMCFQYIELIVDTQDIELIEFILKTRLPEDFKLMILNSLNINPDLIHYPRTYEELINIIGKKSKSVMFQSRPIYNCDNSIIIYYDHVKLAHICCYTY